MKLKHILRTLLGGHHGYSNYDRRGHHGEQHHEGQGHHDGHAPPAYKDCLYCGTPSPLAAQFCPECGQSFAPKYIRPRVQVSPATCPNCGGAIDSRSRFCVHCGAQQ
ncbi:MULTISPECIES: zinc ribbon domain-containing protein [Thermaceae]|uniref:DZANK-type domain-containing protein n=2 Tax=Thermaceae TaxID=188786 RepID=A0A430UKK0_THESC|nr:zinc ribbon domain-containing protein [Meiothermus hypogaeus]MBI5813076.1 zinc ribbon domain-containing protein [Allomeiothermus silvanus]RTI03884.1 hypothetical protein CSW30_14210 [Thermus scotoductus]GEM82231.1 hypothetical protein MHY01S_03970 [Meiothermus hypogaeus NBRC 106114]